MSPKNNHKDSSGNDHNVKERLLDAAEKYFADKGFDATTVREITTYADSNLAAVNYYFGGKENLYVEVFRRRLKQITKARKNRVRKAISVDKPTLKEILDEFANAFLKPFRDRETGERLMKMMINEITNPKLPKSMFVKEVAIPTIDIMSKALRKIYPNLEDDEIFLITFSLAGQLLHVHRITELHKSGDLDGFPVTDIDVLVDHIINFTIAGIKNVAKKVE